MDKKPEKLVPEVRFKGFTDDWEQHKLGILFQKNIERNDNEKFNYNQTLSVSTMTFKPTGNGASAKSLANYKVLRLGDVAFEGHSNKQFSYGRFVVNDNADGIMSPRFATIRPIKAININYWKNYLHNENIMKYVLVKSTKAGTMMNELVYSDLYKQVLKVPNITEQVKIGNLLQKIEIIITLQQRKLKQLNLLQRYIKEKTLPSQKELPKLRFLTTPYNTYKFSELFKKSTKKNDEQILQNHVISVASMRWGKLPKSSSEAYMKTYFIFNKGDIAYEGNRSKSYSFGRFVANDLGNGIVSHVFSVFNSKINFNLEFLKNYINSEQVMRDPLRMSTSRTTMMTNLVLKDIAKQTLMIPSKDEQDLLGSLYKITQSMIELNEKQQQELIYLKKYLLQKLFI